MTKDGAEREQKPDDCVSVIDLYTAALQACPDIARGNAAAALPAFAAVSVSLAARDPKRATPVGNGTHLRHRNRAVSEV